MNTSLPIVAPFYISLLFAALALYLLVLTIWTFQKSGLKAFAWGTVAWIVLVAIAALNGFYLNFASLPPHLIFLVVPPILLCIYFAFSARATKVIESVSLKTLTYVQTFRIGMEIILWIMVEQKIISPVMTFTGQNYDILVGLSAPVIAYLCFTKSALSLRSLRLWNVIGLCLLVMTLVSGILSAPTPLQVFHADVSTAVIATFPFALLPGFVVPFALICHILSIRKINRIFSPSTTSDF